MYIYKKIYIDYCIVDKNLNPGEQNKTRQLQMQWW